MGSSMILDKSSLTAITTRFQGLYDQYYVNADVPDYGPLVEDVPTTAIKETYEYLEDVPGMREWIAERELRDLASGTFDVTNVEYESTVNVKVRDIKADQLGVYMRKVRTMAQQAAKHPAELFTDLVDAAGSTTCFDGQYLVDTDHTVNGSTVSNKSTTALAYDSVVTADETMRAITDEEGRNLGIRGTHLIVPNGLHHTALRIVNTELRPGTANNDTNTLQGLTVVTLPELSDSNNWYLVDASKPVKPVIWQHRELPTELQEDDTKQFSNGEIHYGVYGDYKMAAWDWRVIHGAIVA